MKLTIAQNKNSDLESVKGQKRDESARKRPKPIQQLSNSNLAGRAKNVGRMAMKSPQMHGSNHDVTAAIG